MRQRNEEGYVLVTTLVALAVVMVIGYALLDQATSSLRIAAQNVDRERALYAANAGLEHAVAFVRASGGLVTGARELTGTVGTGTYTITVGPTTAGQTPVSATGSAGRSVRRLTATVSDASSPAYKKAVYSSGSLSIGNNTSICGDIYANGDISLKNGAGVYKTGSLMKMGGLCDLSSDGSAMSAGTLSGDTSAVEGAKCDTSQYACRVRPEPLPFPPIDWEGLMGRATRLYLTDCGSRPNCTKVAPGSTVMLDLNVADGQVQVIYSEVSVWIRTFTNGGQATVATRGSLTFANTANRSVTCRENTCGSAFLAEGPILFDGNGHQVWGAIVTPSAGGVTFKNNNVVHGMIAAQAINGGNNNAIYAESQSYTPTPVGLPGAGILRLTGWAENL